MNKIHGPKNVIIFSYNLINWLYMDIIPILKEKYNTRFIIIGNEDVLEKFNPLLNVNFDKLIELSTLEKKLQEDLYEDIDKERKLARKNEKKYDISYMREIIQQDRKLSTYFLSHSENFIWTKNDYLNDDFILSFVNRCVSYAEGLIEKESIDLALVWPLDALSATFANICEHKNIFVTYPYNSKYKSYGFWASSAFQDDKLLCAYYNNIKEEKLISLEDISPPNTGWPETSEMDKIYSFWTILKKSIKTTLFRIEFILLDILKLDFSKKDRVSYFAQISFHINSWRLYRLISKNSFRDLYSLKKKPYLFFAISLEPEFSVQAKCKEFNDQKSIIKQLAMCLPMGYELIIKEHFDIGRRSWNFYEELCKIPNVRMAHPSIRGIDLVSQSRAVATMAGTVTLEATLMGKKVIEFSNHSSYSFLPNVFKINDFTNLPSILRKVMGEQKKHEIDEVRSYGSRVRKAIIEMSFDAPGSPLFYDDKSYKGLDEINLNKAVTLLLKQYSQNKVNSN